MLFENEVMHLGNIREPIKKSSIEKKNRIIEKGFECMCNKGYHKVNCIDIAKYANVSTGIIYQYFTDKRDIFIEGAKDFSDRILFPILYILDSKKLKKSNIKQLLHDIIESYIKAHTMSKTAHEELMAMSHLDNEIAEIFRQSEMRVTKRIEELLVENDIFLENAEEKIHIAIGIIETYCHEVVYHKHTDVDYNKMKDYVVDILLHLLGRNEINETI